MSLMLFSKLAAIVSHTSSLKGVQFIHQQYVAHLDLKPEHTLVTQCGQRHVIIDFDLSVRVPEQELWIKRVPGIEE
jgi:serine/threonine protein kinase